MQSAVLSFQRITGPHDGESLATVVYNILERANVLDKVCHLSHLIVDKQVVMEFVDWKIYHGQRFQQWDHDESIAETLCRESSRPR